MLTKRLKQDTAVLVVPELFHIWALAVDRSFGEILLTVVHTAKYSELVRRILCKICFISTCSLQFIIKLWLSLLTALWFMFQCFQNVWLDSAHVQCNEKMCSRSAPSLFQPVFSLWKHTEVTAEPHPQPFYSASTSPAVALCSSASAVLCCLLFTCSQCWLWW